MSNFNARRSKQVDLPLSLVVRQTEPYAARSAESQENCGTQGPLSLTNLQDNVARRRGQRSGWLRAEKGSWLLTYRDYSRKPERVTVTIGPANGAGRLTAKQAERFAWDHYLAPLDSATKTPFSMIAMGDFWTEHYLPHLERKRKYATQTQYKSLWKVWIAPALAKHKLFELRLADVDRVISAALAARKGTATAKHIRKVISAVIEHARRLRMFAGDNPAQAVQLPENVPVRRRRAMSLEQCREWFAAVADEPADGKDRRSDIKPVRSMSLLGVCCGLGVSEQLGLRWENVNLTNRAVMVGAEYLEPLSAAIVEHCYHGRRGSLKTGHRRRSVPLPKVLVEALKALYAESKWTALDAPVFAGVSGKPIWADNLVKRSVKPLAEHLGMPWLSWHVLRHTCATLTKSFGMLDVDRRVLMGHAERDMTDHYTHEDWERIRVGVERIAAEVTSQPDLGENSPTRGALRSTAVEIS